MARITIAVAAALLLTATVSAADRLGETVKRPNVEQAEIANAKTAKRPKPTKTEHRDYLVVTLTDTGI